MAAGCRVDDSGVMLAIQGGMTLIVVMLVLMMCMVTRWEERLLTGMGC